MKSLFEIIMQSNIRKILVVVGAISGLFALLSFTSEYFGMYIVDTYVGKGDGSVGKGDGSIFLA